MKEPSGVPKGGQVGPTRAQALGERLDPWFPPFAYLFSTMGNFQRQNPFSRSRLSSAAAALLRSGAPTDLFPSPYRREDQPPGASPPPWTLPGWLVSSLPWSMGPWSVAMWCSPPLFVLHGLDLVSFPTWSRHFCICLCVAMLCLLGSNRLWDYVHFVMSNIFGLPFMF